MADALVQTLIGIVLIAAAAFVLGRFVIQVISRLAKKAGVAPATIQDVREGLIVLIIAAAATSIARLVGVASEFTTLTISGVAGLALSLALQTTLSNIISGMMMLHDNIIRIGDEIEYGAIKGKIVRISFRTTWVKTADHAIVVISNTTLANGPFTNRTATTRLEKILSGAS